MRINTLSGTENGQFEIKAGAPLQMGRSLHIAMIAHSNSPWAPQYSKFFAQRGHRVSVLSFAPGEVDGAQIYCLQSSRGRAPKRSYVTKIFRVRRLLRELNPDVTLATYLRSNGLVASLTKCGPLVVASHGTDQDYPIPLLGPRITRFVCNQAEAIHVVSPELSESLRAIGVPAEKIVIIPVGADFSLFHPRPSERLPGPPRLICTRKHETVYDNATLVSALGLLKAGGFDFSACFVGTGSLMPRLQAKVAEAGLDSCVRFPGAVPYVKVSEQLAHSDVYLSSSLSDGTSSSLLEAIVCGLTPVVTDIRANRAWVKHRESGYLFPPGDAAACAKGIRWSWEHETELAAGKQRALAQVRENGDFVKNTLALEDLLLKVASR